MYLVHGIAASPRSNRHPILRQKRCENEQEDPKKEFLDSSPETTSPWVESTPLIPTTTSKLTQPAEIGVLGSSS
ncbi:hypothetical protein O0I10_006725 [Lichtheimia ornata]|uniref:Uncharacterized protein n=1 Tax=Lichtheimia ornata TaxID=688661 RepID=A0AAD7V2N0_9FUNG|nr:uncharacterized protein O0I10_006725 [Lichtheimia ornata]KAJ8657659.1 hypothetical protein O0I10_006725 [Lichtheimia ornata]